MKRFKFKSVLSAMLVSFALGASFAGYAAGGCRFAYEFCMPRYYVCLAAGRPQSECSAELDACILRNGCTQLP